MRAALLITILLLGACGFTPLYADKDESSVQEKLDQIDIAVIPDRSGQFLRNELIDRFYKNGYPTAPHYRLEVAPINEQILDFDITQEAEATRQQIKLTTTMRLIDTKTKKVILRRNITAITSNNILESEFSTLITEQSAREAALNDIARQIERQLALHFRA